MKKKKITKKTATKKSKVRLTKVKPIKEKQVKVKELYKNKKQKASKINLDQLGTEYFSEVIKTDKDGNAVQVRQTKYIKGKLVKEMVYNYTKDEPEYKLREI